MKAKWMLVPGVTRHSQPIEISRKRYNPFAVTVRCLLRRIGWAA